MEHTLRRDGETFIDYWIRLYEHKSEYGLTCEEISTLLNAENGTAYTESKWRKDFAMFDMGRSYERMHNGGIASNRILCLSDFHVPFQLPIETFVDYKGRIDTLILNGDIGDCQAISKFPKSYRVSPMEELIECRSYLIDLIEYLSPSDVYVLYGNHDIRFQNYLAKNLDSDLLELMPKTSLELICVDGFHHYDKRQRSKVYYPPLTQIISGSTIHYEDNWWMQIGDAIVCHPIAFSNGIMQTAKKAMEFFRNNGNLFNMLVMGHTHRVGYYVDGGTAMYEQGCCCDVTQNHYVDGKLTAPQKEGFIYFAQDIDGHTIPQQTVLRCLN